MQELELRGRLRPWLLGAVVLGAVTLTLRGCAGGCGEPGNKPTTGDPAETSSLAPSLNDVQRAAYDGSWGLFAAGNPAALTSLLNTNSAGGWQKLYLRDYAGARAAFATGGSEGERIGLGRALLEEAILFDEAFRFVQVINGRYQALVVENEARLKRTPVLELAAGIGHLREGQAAQALEKLQAFRASAGADARLKAIATVWAGAAKLGAGDDAGARALWSEPGVKGEPDAQLALASIDASSPLPSVDSTSSYGQRLKFATLVRQGDLEAARALAGQISYKDADFEESVQLDEGLVTRHYYDSGILKSLSTLSALQAMAALEGIAPAAHLRRQAERLAGRPETGMESGAPPVAAATLPVFLFSRFPTPADVAYHGEVGNGFLQVYQQAVGPVPTETQEGRDTRQAVVVAEQLQDAARARVEATGNAEGIETVLGLNVVQADVALAIRERAARYVQQGNLLGALFLLEHTLDKEAGRVNYLNDPLLLLSITRVYCMLGRYREALNYSYRLVDAHPELWLIQEILGNASVLNTVDNAGNSGGQD